MYIRASLGINYSLRMVLVVRGPARLHEFTDVPVTLHSHINYQPMEVEELVTEIDPSSLLVVN